MVAQKRGRGGKAQAAKAKAAAAPAEEVVPEAVAPEIVEAVEDNNGDTEQPTDETMADETMAEEPAESTEPAEETTGSEAAPAPVVEEKVESGKILVENLPSSYLFDYQDKLKELFSQYGEVNSVKRGPIVVTELTTTPTLSAIVEFKNKDSVEKALVVDGTTLAGQRVTVVAECCQDTTVLVGVPYEATLDYVRLLFGECGDITQILEFSKTKYKILRVTFADKECVERAIKLDRELRINGFLVTVAKYRSDGEVRQHNAVNKNKRQYPQSNQNRNANNGNSVGSSPQQQPRSNNYRGRGGPPPQPYNARGTYRGGRGRGGFPARGGAFPRGGFAGGPNSYMPYMAPRPNYF